MDESASEVVLLIVSELDGFGQCNGNVDYMVFTDGFKLLVALKTIEQSVLDGLVKYEIKKAPLNYMYIES